MFELLDRVKELKKLARGQRASNQDSQAVKTIESGIDLLAGSLLTLDPESQLRAAAQLADFNGMLGGALRDKGDLAESAQAYDAGFRYESDPRYGIHSSYNAMNRLTTRILLRPQALADPDSLRGEPDLEFVNVPDELANLRARLESQVTGVRSNDYWAAGDLAVVSALIGDDDGAARAVARFASSSPPPDAYEAYLKSVTPLADLNTPHKRSLERLKNLFSKNVAVQS